MKKSIYILYGAIIIIIIAGLFAFYNFRRPELNKGEVYQEKIKSQTVLIIDDGQNKPQTFNVDFSEGMTAFDLLKSATTGTALALKTKVYDVGIMVQAIGSKENGQDGKYWLYYVNGKMPMVSVDKQKLNLGDQVEFKFEKSPY
jgi:uncharacterized membrane protein